MKSADEFNIAESDLIKKALERDLEAFNQLVLKYQDLTYGRAYSLLRDHDSAEDAAQEAFLRAFQCLNQLRGGSFRAWLLKIVTNTCYDFLRQSKRHATVDLISKEESSHEVGFPDWLVDLNVSVQNSVEQKELSHALYRMLDELPHLYRDILTLIDVYEFDYSEAAAVLEIPLGTVKSRLARARFQLRERISQHCYFLQGFSISFTKMQSRLPPGSAIEFN